MLEINRIYNMDCLEGMREIEDTTIDLTVTSPPYDNLREYKGYSFRFEETAKELFRITKQGGVVVWVVGDATINGSETGTSFKQALYFKEIGFNLHDTMIWNKPNAFNFGSNSCYIQSFEYMFVFSKGKPKATNHIYDRRNEAKGKIFTQFRRSGSNGEVVKTNKKTVTSEMGKRRNVWDIQVGNNEVEHPAPYPEQLANDHILSWSNKGDIVLDPFLGSGTTAKMAIKNERKYIGFEVAKEYYELALNRIKKEAGQGKISKWFE